MKFNEGEIVIDFHDDVLSRLTPEQKKAAALCLVWDDDVLNEFVDKLMEEYISSHYNTNIYKARLRMIEKMPEAARSVIKALMQELATAKGEERRMENWAWKLHHAWPEGEWRSRPEAEKFQPAAFPTDAEVDAAIEKAQA